MYLEHCHSCIKSSIDMEYIGYTWSIVLYNFAIYLSTKSTMKIDNEFLYLFQLFASSNEFSFFNKLFNVTNVKLQKRPEQTGRGFFWSQNSS